MSPASCSRGSSPIGSDAGARPGASPSPQASVGLSMPILIAICAVPDPWLAIALSVPSGIVGSGYAPILFAIAQSLAPARYRAVASSVLILFITGGGMFVGPWAIGLASDLLAPRFGDEALRIAMIGVLATMSVGLAALLAARRSLMTDLERAGAEAATRSL